MLSVRDVFEGVKFASGAIHQFFRSHGVVEYLPLQARGDIYVSSEATSEHQLAVRDSKRRRIRNATIVFLGLFGILGFTIFFSKIFSTNNLFTPSTSSIFVNKIKHPIVQLVKDADSQFQAQAAKQSKTIQEAIAEYERRYQMPPPPQFDKWYQFATQHNVEMIDEYDAIYNSLILFWSVEPAELRKRVREALGRENSIMGVTIRSGEIWILGDGQSTNTDTDKDPFQSRSTIDLLTPCLHILPDMDLLFNVNDESRLLIPHEDMVRMRRSALAASRSVKPIKSEFSRAADLNNGKDFAKVTETRFNSLDQQQVWTHARLACPPDTPARSLDPGVEDNVTLASFEGINFIHNMTLFRDVCLSPSVRNLIGHFNHPNAFRFSLDLVPVFTPSTLSTFQDILYPSTFYYAEKTVYNKSTEVQWKNKSSTLYWRGSTTGAWIQNGIWRQLLRQTILTKLKFPGDARLLHREQGYRKKPWQVRQVPGTAVADRYDTEFTHMEQCEQKDCDEMIEFFGEHEREPQEECWKHKYLLDMDGHALSGRFYAFLESLSLPMKVAYFREWHDSRVIPWRHYVPLTATTDEYAEVLRFFEEEDEGRKIAESIATRGSEWAGKALRKVDMEVYMFRLLLEYARLIDDDREHLGFRL